MEDLDPQDCQVLLLFIGITSLRFIDCLAISFRNHHKTWKGKGFLILKKSTCFIRPLLASISGEVPGEYGVFC